MSKNPIQETPLMKQYSAIKAKYPDALLLFRVGDFYETFGEDAVKASAALGIVLTRRANGAASEVELAGFPHHSLDVYLPKLVKAGHRVAICDQLEDPKMTKTIVKRGVTELVSPGVTHNDSILDNRSNNFLASVYYQNNQVGIALLDISTGEFLCGEGNNTYLAKTLQSFRPAEILLPKSQRERFEKEFGDKVYIHPLDEWVYQGDYAKEKLLKQFDAISLKGFGIQETEIFVAAAGAALHYIEESRHNNLKHIARLSRMADENYVWLDPFTIRNLELVYPSQSGAKTLLDVLDHSASPMGARMLKQWLVLPLKNPEAIRERLDAVSALIAQDELRHFLQQCIKSIGDLERLITKVPLGKINPREMVQLRKSLDAMAPLKERIQQSASTALLKSSEQLNPFPHLVEKIAAEIREDAPAVLAKGNVIREGVHPELDEYRRIISDGKNILLQMQQQEIERTGISSLKIGFNNVFGYYLEVRNTHKEKVPAEWIRKQTLTGAERYVTEELKQLEQKILSAEEKIGAIEEEVFGLLVQYINDYVPAIQLNAQQVAKIDCLLSFSLAAILHNYCKPEINDGLALQIKDGRHPVIEKQLPPSETYVPNDIFLDPAGQQIMVITGPNMSGKSAVLRQTALIVLMAQCGSYVPASSAGIGWVDKIFTRVGASDNISSGESTFMVEMNETASILNNMSERSLVLLDEIGRGTSTYDGISIAWSIAEYLHNQAVKRPKTLFATHYHELNELAEKYTHIRNYHIATRETEKEVIFLRKMKEGGTEHSFGIHVARMAGMPEEVIYRANEMLQELEAKSLARDRRNVLAQSKTQSMQLSIFNASDETAARLKTEIEKIDVNSLSPVEALLKLNFLKSLLEKK